MIQFGGNVPEAGDSGWRYQINLFSQDYRKELAALSWGLWQQNGDSQGTLGIDTKPQPRFVYCPKSAIEKLNRRAESRLREVLGFVDAFRPEKEVLIIVIGEGQIKLIQFESDPPPPQCFEELGLDTDTLLTQLETALQEILQF